MTEERWLPVPVEDFAYKYEVSSYGRVRNCKTGRVLKPMRTGSKRPGSQRSKVRLRTYPRADFDVAHLALIAFVGPRPDGCIAMHRDDDSSNNTLTNLRWGSHADNALDMAIKQRGQGQLIGVVAASEIVRRRRAGETGASLSREFGISQQRVCDLFKGRSKILSTAST